MTKSHIISADSAKAAVVIVAAGQGRRAGGDIPKQFQNLAGSMVVSRTIKAFAGFTPIVVVAHPDWHDAIQSANPQTVCVAGGDSRTASVFEGLKACKAYAPDAVLIHDGARPLVSEAVIMGVLAGLDKSPAAVPTLPIIDAVKFVQANPMGSTLGGDADRSSMRRVQTPQGFHYGHIFSAFNALPKGQSFSDDIAVAHAANMRITMTEGDPRNIKITYPEDFTRAEQIMAEYISVTGNGYDVHRLVDGDHMYLCGVKIAAEKTLLGHSDADVGLHAITDAVFGAMAAGDIGDHFPPSDDQWKGASSDRFLKFAAEFVAKAGGHIDHIDVTLICEAPKIKPHREAMRKRISEITDTPLDFVSVKATTTEKLGFTGRGEGIAAQASVTVRRPR